MKTKNHLSNCAIFRIHNVMVNNKLRGLPFSSWFMLAYK